jgi:ATP-dependent DNA ligase
MRFLYPPRPEQAIVPSLIPFYEKKGWMAQIKKNGTASVVGTENGQIEFRTRQNEAHKAWTPTKEAKEFFLKYPDSYFVFELLHSKGGGVRDTIYLFDVLRYRGESLVDWTFTQRMGLLYGLKTEGRITTAPCFESDLRGLYDGLKDPLDEGIVLKDPRAKLLDCRQNGKNAAWQVKCRKPTKNFGF